MQNYDQATVVALTGDYDVTRRDELDETLDRYGDVEPLVLDVALVDRFDSAALRSLVRFQRARQEAGRAPFALANPNAPVRRFLELAQVDRAFTIIDSA